MPSMRHWWAPDLSHLRTHAMRTATAALTQPPAPKPPRPAGIISHLFGRIARKPAPAATPSFDSPLRRIAMVSTHGYVAAQPPLGAADTGGQVVYVIELSKKLAQLGFEVDIWTRRFENQPEIDDINEHVRVIRVPCGGPQFRAKEYLVRFLAEWAENALRFIDKNG